MASLPEYAIKQRVTTVMVFLAVVFLGSIAVFSLQKEYFPSIEFPQVTVITDYVNAAPEEMETLITRPLEEAISSVSGLRQLESISREGKSTITVSFGWNENIDLAALAVREKIDLVKERLPKESEDPVVLKFDPLARPIVMLSVTGNMHPADLKTLAERVLKENLEKVEGVASVNVAGGLDREVQIDLDQGLLQTAQVSILDVIDAVDSANISYPAGSIKKGLYEYLIRTVGEFRSVPEIGYTVVTTDVKEELRREADTFLERGRGASRETLESMREEELKKIGEKRLVLINDIGTVTDSYRDRSTISRFNGKENVSVSVQKQGSANVVEVADRIKRELLFLEEEIENRGLSVEVVYDQSAFVQRSISNVRNAAVIGGLLAAAVLLLFFRNWLAALIVAAAIPISVMGAFFLFMQKGITMNMISLLGLALGAGMIVDNSIVVIENIFRLRQGGKSPEEAAVRGTNEVVWPIFSSTLTTIVVFIPILLFVPGVAGQLFKDLAWAVIFALSLSFFVAIALVPMFSLYMGHVSASASSPSASRFVQRLRGQIINLSPGQKTNLFWAVTAAGFGLFLLSLLIFRTLDTEVLPKIDQGQFLIRVNLPVGSRLEAADQLMRILEEELKTIPEVGEVSVTIGSSESSKPGEVSVEILRPHQGIVFVSLAKKRRRSSDEVISELRGRLERHELEKAEIEFVAQGSEFEFAAGGSKPIVIEVKGYELNTLAGLAEEIERMIRAVPGVREVINNFGKPSPETKVEIDRRRSALYGISARDISLTAKAGIEGAIATKFKEAGREIDVRVRLRERDRADVRHIGDLLVYSDVLEVPVPVKEVAAIHQGYGPSEIKRKDQIRTITVSAAIEKGFKEKDVLAGISSKLSGIQIPEDYTVDLVGKAEEVRRSFRMLAFAFAIALIFTYMIMAAQFESFLHPFVIILTVPLASIGVALGLLVTGTSVNVISLLGVLILAGTVVNNAIVLVDFINQSRRQGMGLVEACLDASVVRLRPILMSTVTTVVGLIPLALGLGEGAEVQAPLAIAIIGGLVSATFFTLCVIPSIYALLTRAADRLYGVNE